MQAPFSPRSAARCGWLILVLILCLPTAGHGAPRLDKRAISALAAKWFAARPATQFETPDHAARQAMLTELDAFGELPEGSLEEVLALVWKQVEKHAPKFPGRKMPTPYEGAGAEAIWDESGRGGAKKGLLIGLHGGGPGAGDKREPAGKWKLGGTMAIYPQGVHLVHDTWNSVHGERFVLSLIEYAKARHGIDPDRVYVAGFSMGGSGSMFLAGRHPDLLAGAIPAHGVIPARPGVKIADPDKIESLEWGLLPNLRNLGVWFYTGSDDVNCEPGTFHKAWQEIGKLREADPKGWKDIHFERHEGVAHTFPPGEPGAGLKWLAERRRDPYPKTIAWEYNAAPSPFADANDRQHEVDRRPKRWMYWLHCQRPEDRMQVNCELRTEADGTVIDLSVSEAFPDDFTIWLRPEMYEVSKDVIVRVAGEERWRGRPRPTLRAVIESLDARLDRSLTFDRYIRVPEPE